MSKLRNACGISAGQHNICPSTNGPRDNQAFRNINIIGTFSASSCRE
jgi:hypothetical protein